jgi:hypothetical protein
MQGRTKFWLASLLVLALFLSACNFGQEPEPTPDVGAIFTAAAETVQAQFGLGLTQTAMAAPPPTATQPPLPPTATPFATFAVDGSNAVATPLPVLGAGTQPSVISTLPTVTPIVALATEAGPLCLDSAFISDVNYADGTVVEDNTLIAKAWQIQNTGTCTWDDGFSLRPVTGSAKGTWDIKYKKEFVEPDEIVEVKIEIKTPSTGGDWGGCWRMYSDSEQPFGTFVCLLVKVE